MILIKNEPLASIQPIYSINNIKEVHTKMSEEELQSCLQQVQQGDKEAFARMYSQYKDHIYRMVTFLVNDRNDTNDVVSEVYIALFRSLANYDVQKPFTAWLNGLIVFQTRNWNRTLWRKFRLQTKTKDEAVHSKNLADSADIHLLQHEEQHEVLQIVQKLPFKLKSVVLLRYYQEYSFQQIADVLEIPLGTAKSRHHKAIQQLRKYVDVLPLSHSPLLRKEN